MKHAKRRRLLVLLILAHLAVAWIGTPDEPRLPAASGAGAVRALRAAAQAHARAAGRETYTFETTWSPPLAAHQ